MKGPIKLEKRVKVDLPIKVSIEDQTLRDKVSTHGRVNDLSINGMKLSLPLAFGMIEEKDLDFDLELPNPFAKIKGRGKVQWKQWDEDKNCFQFGLALEPLTLKQLSDLDCIVNELSEEE